MMLEDLDYRESIADIIQRQKVNAEYAVAATGENFSQMFSEMDDEYMRARAADVKDVSDRLLRVLAGQGDALIGGEEPVIVAAGDLTPSETVQLDKDKVLAFATAEGSSNSHTAILARTMQIPAVIGLGAGLDRRYDGVLCAVDGAAGELVVDPDEQTLAALRQKQREDEEAEALLQSLRGQENVTKDGRHIDVFANVGSVADVGLALQSDAGGVGLFRSEFLYLENSDYPTEGEQFAAYKAAGEILAGRRVIIRTLDIGADKQIGYFHLPQRGKPRPGVPGHPPLPRPGGDVQDPAAGHPLRLRLRQPGHHVPHGHLGGGGAPGQGPPRRPQSRAAGTGRQVLTRGSPLAS